MNIKDFGLPLEQSLNAFYKDLHDTLKKKFKGRIKPGFLSVMENIVRNGLPPEKLIGEIPFTPDGQIKTEMLMAGYEKRDPMYVQVYSYCRLIVSFHSSKFAFESDEIRRKNEKSDEYKLLLAMDVLKAFFLKDYNSPVFERNQLVVGDEFAFFPVPYYCSVMTGRMIDILRKNYNQENVDNPYFRIYDNLICKSLSVYTLLQDGHYDGAYTIERSMIEIFIKLYALKLFPECIPYYYKFMNYQYDRSCGNDALKSDIEREYDNRLFRADTNMVGFKNYGWVEHLPDYSKYIDVRPYTFASLKKFIESVCSDEFSDTLEMLNYFYGLCHGYTHGEVTMTNYSFLHYMEISYILALIIPVLYKEICTEYECQTEVSDIDLLKEFSGHFEILINQYNSRSTELFEAYYKRMREMSV